MPEDKPTFTWRQKYQALARQLAPYRRPLLLLAATEIVIAGGNAVIPLVTGRFFDALITPRELSFLGLGSVPVWAWLLSLWAAIQLITNAINVVADRRTRFLTTEIQGSMEAQGYSFALTLPISFHKKQRAGEVMDTIGRASWMLDSMVNTALSITPQLLTLVIGIGIAFSIRASLAWMLLGGIAVYSVVLIRTLPFTAKRQEEAFRVWRNAHGDAADAYANVTTVKQAGAERFEAARIRKGFSEGAIPLWHQLERLWSQVNTWQRIVVTLTQGAIFLFSVFLITKREITIGDLIAFNAYAGMIIGPFVSIGTQWQTVQNGLTTLAALDEIFKLPPELYDPSGAEPLGALAGAVTFTDVHFRYEPDQPEVLAGLSFDAKPGQIIALVGQTGAGKSTTAELISGYYFADSGSVEIDGHDIRRVSLVELRSQIAVVPQEVVLFNASIADNIRYGRPDASEEAVRQAATRAHAADFIERFPKKYEQEVGERGVKLSVGQKQRVAIARAILRDPKILILDEPTSALDAETEQYITQSLDELMQGRTTFIIAHRLSTVRKADLILVLKDGAIAERGTHDELVAIPNGVYRHLYELHVGLHE
ncbi:MAG: ABC transporter ATP-binding protein [Patescibacteria group bacterium]|nr:ABC transporter ATP-binding protein/permease [Patescibacteria group bacterium]MDE1943958.1 ABC transporter ATP-binding protein [Patescibacteria group bacterium]MDE1944937.1 ABC transporter ATP-binding protein [Patescibacteria group bacterium]MDE2057537.1 ABC transporter ATP-binding protein [Patescibacteria group bacterium]